jgi:hypothetical protein
MKNPIRLVPILSFTMLIFVAQAKVITVTTTNNVSPGVGETNLVQAIEALEDGGYHRF